MCIYVRSYDICVCMGLHVYIHVYMSVYVYIYIYIYILEWTCAYTRTKICSGSVVHWICRAVDLALYEIWTCSRSVVHWICRSVDVALYEIWPYMRSGPMHPEADLIDGMGDPAADLTPRG